MGTARGVSRTEKVLGSIYVLNKFHGILYSEMSCNTVGKGHRSSKHKVNHEYPWLHPTTLISSFLAHRSLSDLEIYNEVHHHEGRPDTLISFGEE